MGNDLVITLRLSVRSLRLVLLILLAACDHGASTAPPASSAAAVIATPSASVARAAASATPHPHPKPSPSALRATVPFTETQKKAQPTYVSSLARGRAATRAHDYDKAVREFEYAVLADQDGRAHSERGYAYLLDKKYDLAAKDFETASDFPSDADLLGQVWWNRALAYGALGRPADADVAFFRSNHVRPTKAAASKLAGKNVCPVTVSRVRKDATPFAGWVAWETSLAAEKNEMTGQGFVEGETEAQAKSRLCPGCTGEGPWTINFGDDGTTFPRMWQTHVVAEHAGKLWDYGVFGTGYEGPVSGEPCWTVDTVSVGKVGTHAYVMTSGSRSMRVPMKRDTSEPCPDGAPWDACERDCFAYADTERYAELDVAHPSQALIVTAEDRFARAESAPPPDVKVVPQAEGFDLQGEGCALVPFLQDKH